LFFAGLLVAVGLVPVARQAPVRVLPMAIGALLAVIGVVRPSLLHVANVAWFHLGLRLHRVLSPVVLGFLFFAVVSPWAMLLRLAGKDVLDLELDPNARSYWRRRAPASETALARFRRQY
jgi:hypothetical protein